MTHTLAIFANGEFSLLTIAIFGVAGFAVGFLLRMAVTAKEKKNVLKLEDEMLKNHSRILSLEKKISTLERENTDLSKFTSRSVGLKVS